MEVINLLLKILFVVFLGATIAGLIKPWWVLWFLDFKNRLTVLRYYGLITLFLLITLLILPYLK